MNNLKNGVTINSFDLPGNDPAGGIRLTLDTIVTNVSLQVAFLCSAFRRYADSLHKLVLPSVGLVFKLTLETPTLGQLHRTAHLPWRP
jgi:hypothetical protein